MNEFYADSIDRYLRGEMTAKESLLFEQEALNNSELRKEIELRYLIKRSLIDRERKLHTTQHWEKKKRSHVIGFAAISSIAAILIIGFIFFHTDTGADISGNNTFIASVESSAQKQLNIDDKQAVAKVKTISKGKDGNANVANNQLEHEKIMPTLSNSPEKSMMTQTMTLEENETLNVDSYELNWLRICNLNKNREIYEAIKLLENYVRIEGTHKEEADSLLRTLKAE